MTLWPPEPEVVHIRPNSELARVIAETTAKINGCFPEGRKFPAKLKRPPIGVDPT